MSEPHRNTQRGEPVKFGFSPPCTCMIHGLLRDYCEMGNPRFWDIAELTRSYERVLAKAKENPNLKPLRDRLSRVPIGRQ
jgi:hypothetical protein